MSSEKPQNNKISPLPNLGLKSSKKYVESLSFERLLEIVWHRIQTDEILKKIVLVSIAFSAENKDYEMMKAAIDCALRFSDYIRYNEHGHDQILTELEAALKAMLASGEKENVIRIGQYLIEKAEAVAENFEEDWSWMQSVDSLKNLINSLAGPQISNL